MEEDKMKQKDKKKKQKAIAHNNLTAVDSFMNLPDVQLPGSTAEAKPMQRCVKFKNPMVALEHDIAMKMVDNLNPNLVIAKEVEDGYDMYVKPMAVNDPYLNNIYTGINAIEIPSENSIRINEVKMLNEADHDVVNAYCKEKKRTMLVSLADMVNANFRSIIYHANKAVMDVLLNEINGLGFNINDNDKQELYEIDKSGYLFSILDLDSIDLDMYQIIQRSNDLWEAENPKDPDNAIARASAESSMNLGYGVLYQITMQAIASAYTSIGDHVRTAVYVYMGNYINIAQADMLYNDAMEYANECMLNYGEVIFDNVQKVCEALPSVQEAYYRRNISNWDEDKYGISIEDGVGECDNPKIGIF
jgi:hypothetical protein